jgi:hypothetical protein
MYMTPERFRTFGTGIDLTDISDMELRTHLNVASSLVDSFCNVPLLPTRYDFRGGEVTREERRWRLADGRGSDWGSRRFYPGFYPVKEISEFRIWVTDAQYVAISPSDLVINNASGWVEVVSLAVSQVGIFGYGLLPVIGLNEPIVRMSYTYGYQFTSTNETLEPTDAREYRAQNQFWEAGAEVKVNGAAPGGSYDINETEGTVVFADQLADSDVVTATYTYGLPASIAQATAITAASSISEQDLTAKGMNRLEALQVEEVTLRRTVPQRASAQKSEIPPLAAALLEPFVFRTVR